MTKFLEFVKLRKHRIEFEVLNRKTKDVLGYIFFYRLWKKWVFEVAYDEIVFDAQCLKDITEFLKKVENEYT